MEWSVKIEKEIAGIRLNACAGKIGEDVLICLEGGNAPHIGCVVQAVPRPSLTGDGTTSATASVLNLTGHKDEFLCRKLAEQVCSMADVVTVCTGGVHLDHIKEKQIRELMCAMDEIGKEIAERLLSFRLFSEDKV